MPYLLVRHRVKDYANWKAVFELHEPVRSAHGCRSARIFHNADNLEETVVLLEWDSLDNARRFVQSDDLRQTMERAGVIDPPDFYFLDEVGLLSEQARE